jgi:hypothetical protein
LEEEEEEKAKRLFHLFSKDQDQMILVDSQDSRDSQEMPNFLFKENE